MALHQNLEQALTADAPAMLETYKHFHAHPELSMQETQTSAEIEQAVQALGYETFRCAGTGVVAVLRNGEGQTIAYRADIDGLPIEEDTGSDFASRARGTLADGTETFVMHGCGHDTHITVGLETAKLMAEHQDLWSGTLVLLFQPAEETAAGSAAMVADGLWDRAPRPDAIYGQHVWPGRAGTVDLMLGTAMATADSLEVTVYGKQAHGSQPEASIDPIVLGASMVTRLQTIVSRELGAQESAVVTVGSFHGGLKENIIPDKAVFTINVRTLDHGVRVRVNDAIRRIIAAEAQASGAPEPQIRELYQFPECDNDPQLAADLDAALRAELGEDSVINPSPRMGSEDFGTFGAAIDVPYVFWFFGSNDAAQLEAAGGVKGVPGNHSPFFMPSDVPLTLATGARAALTALFGRLGK
ncbi:amidohydrolase [Brevibacterium sp. 50QC2O2]|jgi:amidohydrolase|uniref:amidohydrolase n=1 Tax=Brevibacterium TaxID=1696 RepID=UPI00211C5A98|nr:MULTISPECIES: amidohydrolase [unclassified Brevibacterium]MCQ9367992.1 amidohydrolase [Brevibacterium sp. 91QC2O2]MCQ9386395.1 amidohydrolase [Brevibacterium sp. 68QC2CO]MCQ9387092.1 amidohydrolase [Brevibacterium sp. 50QC2O2]